MPDSTTKTPAPAPELEISAFADDAMGDLDTVGLVERIQSGEVSIPEVTEAAIARVQAVAPELGAVAFEAYDEARRLARHPRGGFFAGVPTMLKDNVDVAGMPTMHGTDAWVGTPARRHGDFARMFLGTGLLPLGKTQLSEFGFSGSSEHPRLGPVRNPWESGFSSGASSAGAGALVASGALPIAHGNDGGGSIRIPAAVNGLVGLKPTRNRLAQDKMVREMPVRIVSDGVLTRTVRDTAAFFREAEKVFAYPGLAPIGDVRGPSDKRLRIAVITRSVDREADQDVIDETLRVAELLASLGHEVHSIEPPAPETFPEDFLLYWSVLAVFLLRNGRRQFGPTFDRAATDNLTRGLERHFLRHAYRFPLAVSRLSLSRHKVHQLAKQYDVVLSPTLAHATPELGWLDPDQSFEELIEKLRDWVAFTPLANANGQPAISLPLGLDPQGLPLGMMLSADWGQERMLLELAYELEPNFTH